MFGMLHPRLLLYDDYFLGNVKVPKAKESHKHWQLKEEGPGETRESGDCQVHYAVEEVLVVWVVFFVGVDYIIFFVEHDALAGGESCEEGHQEAAFDRVATLAAGSARSMSGAIIFVRDSREGVLRVELRH